MIRLPATAVQKWGPAMAEEREVREDEGREFTGRSVDDAVSKALTELGLRRDQVDVTIISEGRPGILGVGAQPARVRVAAAPAPAPRAAASAPPPRASAPPPRPAPPSPAEPDEELDDSFVNQGVGEAIPALAMDLDLVTESAVDILQTLLQLLGFDADVTAREPETPGDGAGMMSAVLDVTGVGDRESGVLIGRRGETLAALQYLLNLMVNHQTRSHQVFSIDVEGYRRRREVALQDLARRIADRVRQNGQAMTLEPMPPAERRIVHIALADDPDVQTVSIGEGEARKVAITPRR